ncbi:interleukin-4 receptor subunit alpha [Ctenodactylus gundi]
MDVARLGAFPQTDAQPGQGRKQDQPRGIGGHHGASRLQLPESAQAHACTEVLTGPPGQSWPYSKLQARSVAVGLLSWAAAWVFKTGLSSMPGFRERGEELEVWNLQGSGKKALRPLLTPYSHPRPPPELSSHVSSASRWSLKILQMPTCFSDYLSISTCEWQLAGPLNCTTTFRLTYQLLPEKDYESYTCVPENSADAACVCHMLIEDPVSVDTYQLDLWAGTRLLWTHGSFKPRYHVKPRTPRNLTVQASTNTSDMWLLAWSDPYPDGSHMHKKLTYLVSVWSDSQPENIKTYNVTYKETILRLEAHELKSGVTYRARVKARAPVYQSAWSEWSPSVNWYNYYDPPLEERLRLGVSISCFAIVAICLSCYFSVTKIKKEWWDQIPNPACSPVVAIVIQDPQASPWEKPSRGQEPRKDPRWKTCLTKLLPCLLEHDMEREEDVPKAARSGPFQDAGKSACPGSEMSRAVLRPESISVVQCVELLEAPADSEQEEEEEDEGDLCPSPESSRGSVGEGREGIAARLTESLFLGLLGAEDGLVGPPCPPPPGSSGDWAPWATPPAPGQEWAVCWDTEQRFHPEPSPTASTACSEVPLVTEDNPAYRSFSALQGRVPSPGELDPGAQQADLVEDGVASRVCTPQSSEPRSWEQILRQSVLQHQTALAPTAAPTSGYREFVQAMRSADAQGGAGPGCRPSGYKAISSLLPDGAACAERPAGGGDGSYKPFQSLPAGCPENPAPVAAPLFVFGLDMEPPPSPHDSLLASSPPEHLGLGPEVKAAEDRQKPPEPSEQAADPFGDDLGSGVAYSALTCHLCGHLKQCHGQEKVGPVHTVASPCCGCCCGDRASPLGALVPTPSKLPLKASLSPASLVSVGVSGEGQCSLSFRA